MAITYVQANKILEFNFGNRAYAVNSPVYVGLSTTTINSDGTGATEPVGNAYARVAITNNDGLAHWSGAATSVLSNAVAINFPESTGSWGTITYVFIADAITAGNILYYDVLSPSRAVAPNTTVYFAIGSLQISMSNV